MARGKSARGGSVKAIVTIVILAVCAMVLLYGFGAPDIQLTDTQIRIKGMFGTDIELKEVERITLLDKSMREIGIGERTNGFGGLGSTLKGKFASAALGKYRLYVDADAAPTLWIETTSGEDVYISFDDSQKTRDLFAKLEGQSTK